MRAFPLGPAWRQAISGDRHKFGFAKRRERGAGPAAPPPGVVGRRERVGSDSAFERLLIRCEFDVGAELVWSKRRESDARLEGAAVEMGMFAGPLERERDAAKVSGVGHCELRLLGRRLCYEPTRVFLKARDEGGYNRE